MTTALKTKEKPAHTPGPWTSAWVGTRPHGVAVVWLGENTDKRIEIIGTSKDEANARLIAAAPEMLEALRNLVMDWERVIGPIPEDHEAQVAIAKAEGGAA